MSDCKPKLIESTFEKLGKGKFSKGSYIDVCDTDYKHHLTIGPLYFEPNKKDNIEAMPTGYSNEIVRHLEKPVREEIVNFYNQLWNEKNKEVLATWKDTANAAGGRRSKKSKKTKKAKISKRAKKSIKNKRH